MSKEMKRMAVRLALRAEGKWWNAYIAQHGTMEGAFQIGSILLATVERDIGRKQKFIDMMSGILADGIEDIIGHRPEMEVEAAPESERAGTA